MSCNIGLHKTVERIIDNKPWFKYKLGQSYVEILNSPKEKINRDNAYRVAQTLANFLNKAIQNGPIEIGKVFYPEQNQNRFFVTIKPTTVQLNKLNENEKILTEAEIEENEKALEDIPASIDDEQLELNKEEFEEDEPYTSFENFKFKTGQLALFSNSYIKDGKDELIKQKYFPNSNQTTSTAILQKIALSDHPLASVAGNLLQYDPEVSIELVDSETLGDFVDDSGVMQRASAEYSKNKIRIAKNASFKGLGSEPTIVHEIVHAMTHRYISNNSNSEEVKALNEIYKHALTLKNKMPADSYPFTNLDEFIVAVFTNASTIKFLLGQPSISKSEPNLLADIFRAIMNLFKLDTSTKTLFNDAFIAATNIIIAQDNSNKRNQEDTFFIADDGTLFNPTSKTVKPGVTELFESNPELSSIGTQAQYSQYLDTIFPDSKVKDIVYHGSKSKFEKFDKSKLGNNTNPNKEFPQFNDSYLGFHFTSNPEYYRGRHEFGSKYEKNLNEYIAILDIKKPKDIADKDEFSQNNIQFIKPEDVKNNDSIIYDYLDTVHYEKGNIYTNNYVVFEPEQIHILGSKQDIEGFKEFVDSSPLLQLEGVNQTEASPETVAKLTELLQSLNIPVEQMDQLFAQLGVNGLADGVNRLIQIAKGKESVALTEETMHMLTLMAPAEMMDNLMKNIEDYRIYKEVYGRYKGHPAYQNQDGTPNERMIKLEAVGKLLAEYYIMNAENLNPEEVNVAKTIWGALKDWIKNIFGTRVDSFQDFINKVNSGKYFTESMQTRDDRLLQLAFTKDDSYDMVDRLTSNLTTMASYEQAKKDFKKDDKSAMNPNVKAMMALEQAISKFTLRDLPEINNLQSFIHLPKKRAFATSKFKLQEASKEIQAIDDADYFKQFKDKALESLEYIRNMDTVSESLVERINLIKKTIKDNINYDKEGHPTLDPEDRIRMHHEMEMIQSTMHIYQDELKQLAGLFEDLGEGNPVSQMVKDITGKVTSAIIDTDNSLKENLRETLSKFVTPQVENYKKLQNKQLIDYQKQLNDVEQNIARKRSRGDSVERLEKQKLALEEKIKQVQDNIENPPISVNNIMDILENSEGVSNLGKWSLSNLTESGRTNKNQAILAIATILNNATLDSHKDAETSQGVLRTIFNKFKRKQNVAGTAFDDIVDQVVRYKFNEDTLELEEYDDRVLTRDVKQWLFEDDLEVLKYLYSRAETNPADIDDIAEEYKKYIGEDLTDAEKANLVDTFKNKHNELIKNFGKTKYNDAYNQVQKILDDVVLSTGETVREYRRAFTERLTAASNVIDETMNDEVALEIALQDKADVLRELQQLESLFDYNTGQDKTGDALLVAETISRWKKAKKNVEVSPGVFENIDEYYTTYAAELKWKQEKDEHETGIADAEADYNANPTQANKDKLTALKNSYSLWRKLNVSMRASDKFYADRAQIIEAIQTIIDSTKINDRAEKAFAMEYDLAWQSLSALTSGSRDENGVIEGSNLMRGSQKIKEAEEKIENLKSTIKSLRKRLTKEDYEDLVNLIDDLNEMQESTFTEYWDRLYLSKYNNERLILMSNGNTNPTHAEIVDSLMDTDFFKKNTIDVTDKYSELADDELPKDVIKYHRLLGEGRMAVRIVKPIYIWRQSLPIGNYAKEDQMSFNLKNYKVNSVFENPEHETMDGKIALDPSKVTTNPLSASRYENKKFSQLKTEQKEFLDEVRKFYYADQMKKFRKDRLGDSLPRISASKTGRKIQLINPRNWRGRKIFSKQALTDRLLGNTTTKVEKEYIQGDLKNSNKKIFAKYTYGKTTHSTQEKDLFKLLAMYNSETHRVERLKEYIPALNTASKLSADKKISKALNYQINYGLNQTTKAGELGKTVDAISDTARSTKGFLRLGLPWQIGSVLKNTVVGSYAIWSNASKLKQYSEGMFRSAYMKALPFSAMLVAEKFSATPSKKTAILRRLNVVSGYDINDATGNNADVLLKTANGLGYAMGSIRTVSENQLDITMYELYRDGNKIIVNGQAIDIEDMYDYDNGVLTPKPGLTSEIENQFTNSIEEMKSYTQGNFASNNVSLLQAYFLGRTILFMRKHIYNPLMRRIGQKRYTSTGHEIEGFYRIMGAILKSSFKNRSYLKSLSHNEKTAVDAFVKDVVMTSLLGVALYYIEKGFKEGDGNDQDDWLSWYAFLIFRKSVAEISFLNPVEKVAMIYHVLTTKGYNKMSGNPIKSMLMYAIGNPAMEAAATTFIPFDYNTLKFQEKITSNDPYYGQFKNNALLYNFLRLASWKNDYEYSKSSLSAYEWYNPSGFQYTKGNEFEGKAKGGRKKKKKISSGL